MNLKEQLASLQKELLDIRQKAADERRDFTDTELTLIEKKAAEATTLKAKIDRVDASQKALQELIDLGTDSEDDDFGGVGVKYLTLGGPRSKHAASQIATAMRERGQGQKSLVSAGSIVTPVPLNPQPIEEKRIPTSILDLIGVVERESPSWRGIRQTGFTNAAQIVPSGATKPTSTATVEAIEGSLSVIAHLSEAVDRYLLDDAPSLMDFLQRQLLWGLQLALEEEVLNGDGSEDTIDGETFRHFDGLLHVDGRQTLGPISADPLVTLRSSATMLEAIGYETSAFIVNPYDWEGIETARNTSGDFDLGPAISRAERRAWGTRVVTSSRLPLGHALAVDLSTMRLSADTAGIEIRWTDQGPELFDKNKVKARVEGRFGLEIFQPEGIVEIELYEPGS